MSRPAKNKLLLSAAAILTIFAAVGIVQTINYDSANAQAGGEMPAMPVPYITVVEKPVQIWKEFSARLSAVDYVEIRPQVDGLIEEINFTDGQMVKAGDLLYKIDPRPYAAAVAQAKADLNAASEDSKYAEKELARAEELMKTGALSKQVYDQRINAQKVAKSQIAAASARVKSAQVDLDNASIKAPISGRISRAEITQGNLVSAASAPLLTTIVSDKEIYSDFEVDEQTYLKYVRQQSSQTVETEQTIPVKMQLGGDEKWYEGKIKSFDNKIDPSSGTIRARAIFSNYDGALLPGMFTRVQIGSASEENRIAIPEKAISTDQNRKFVYIVGQDNAATYREVKPGETANGDRIILSGLQPGDRVIVDGIMKIRPGAKVQPMTPEELANMKAQAAAGAGAPPQAAVSEEAAPAAVEEAPVVPLEEPVATETPEAPVPLEIAPVDVVPDVSAPIATTPEDLTSTVSPETETTVTPETPDQTPVQE